MIWISNVAIYLLMGAICGIAACIIVALDSYENIGFVEMFKAFIVFLIAWPIILAIIGFVSIYYEIKRKKGNKDE